MNSDPKFPVPMTIRSPSWQTAPATIGVRKKTVVIHVLRKPSIWRLKYEIPDYGGTGNGAYSPEKVSGSLTVVSSSSLHGVRLLAFFINYVVWGNWSLHEFDNPEALMVYGTYPVCERRDDLPSSFELSDRWGAWRSCVPSFVHAVMKLAYGIRMELKVS